MYPAYEPSQWDIFNEGLQFIFVEKYEKFSQPYNPNPPYLQLCQSQTKKKKKIYNRELNYLRMSHRFEEIILFRQHLTYNSRAAWHKLYAMHTSNFKLDDAINLSP